MSEYATTRPMAALPMGDSPDAYVTNFQARVLHDAWVEGSRTYWARRAAVLEAARPRPGDRVTGPASVGPDVDWSMGWPTECPMSGCQASVTPQQCRHRGRRRPLRPDELPLKPREQGPSQQELRDRYDELTAAAAACRARATGLDGYATGHLVDSLHDLSSGDAA